MNGGRANTRTGGREATQRIIIGNAALSVNHPGITAPDGWQWMPLGSVARMESGHTPSRKKAEYWGGDIPWIGIRDAKAAHGGAIESTLETTNTRGIENSSARVLPAGTVCLSRTASVGYVVVMGRDMATSQDFANWICSDRLHPKFLQYLFLAESSALARFSSGSVHQTIYYPELKAFHVCIPSLDEQKRIVAILDQAFAALDRARAHAEANLADADCLYASTLDELIQQQRSGWNVGTVSSLVGEVSTGPFGSLLHKRDYIDGGIPIVNPSNIVEGVITPDWSKTVSADAAERLSSYRLRVGDLVIGRRGEMGRCAPVLPEMEGWLCGTGSFIIRPKSDVSPEFVSYLMRSPTIVDRLSVIATGATMPNLSNHALAQMPFGLPAYDVQIMLLEQMKTLEAKATKLGTAFAAKLTDITALRQSLLQQAFSGQL